MRTSETHCDDAPVWQAWEERTTHNPDDTVLHTLHTRWIELCIKVQNHELMTDQEM